MNGCFYTHSFPLAPQIEPIFIGFQTASSDLIKQWLEYFKRYEPIGCRDNATCVLFRQQGVDAYVTGCLSMGLPLRKELPPASKVFFIGGETDGLLPPEVKENAPWFMTEGSTYISQRMPVVSWPLNDCDELRAEEMAFRLLATYRAEATVVVTSLLHAAGPCLAMGIPVILARKNYGRRFTAIDRLLRVHTPGNVGDIDWQPNIVNVEALKTRLYSVVKNALQGFPPNEQDRSFLMEFYEESTPKLK
jgi:hypothetical protein